MLFQKIIIILLVAILPIYGSLITKAEAIWPITVTLFALFLIRLGQSCNNKIKYIIIPIFFTVNFINIAFFISYYLQDSGFNSAFLYHINKDIIFADIGSYWWLIVFVLSQSIFLIILLLKALKYYKPINSNFKLVVFLILLTLSFYLSPPTNQIIKIIDSNYLMFLTNKTNPTKYNQETFSDFTNRKQIKVEGTQNFTNFVFIYLESLEQSYFNYDLFPGLVPGLKKIRDNSINFQNIESSPGMGWTTAGIVTTQCGLPLSMPFKNLGQASVGLFGEFMPKAECLGDLLSESSYSLTYMGGADLRFGGKGAFFSTHGFDKVFGRNELQPNLPEKTPLSWWGIYDEDLINLAFEKYLELSRTKNPFGLFILTLDTHHPDGYPSPACTQYPTIDNKILHAVHCTDQVITRFVKLIRKSPYSKNTLIFFLSDHLAQRNTASDYLEKIGKKRRLTFFVNYPDGRNNVNLYRGTALDIPATVIDLLDIKKQGELLGFGRSLMGQNGYFAGVFDDINTVTAPSFSKYVMSLWEDEKSISLQSGALVSLRDSAVFIGESRYNLKRWGNLDEIAPTLFEFDSKEYSLSALYSYSQLERIPSKGFGNLMYENPSSIYLAVSPAKYLAGILKVQPENDNDVYVILGKSEEPNLLYSKLEDDIIITAEMVKKIGMRYNN